MLILKNIFEVSVIVLKGRTPQIKKILFYARARFFYVFLVEMKFENIQVYNNLHT